MNLRRAFSSMPILGCLVACVPQPASEIGDLHDFLGPPAGTAVVLRDQEMGVDAMFRSEVSAATGELNVTVEYTRIRTGEVLTRQAYSLHVTDEGLAQNNVNGTETILIASTARTIQPEWPGITMIRADSERDMERGNVTRVSSRCEIAAVAPLPTLGVVRRAITVRCESEPGAEPAFTRTMIYAAGLGLVGTQHVEKSADGSTFVGEDWVLNRVE